MCETLAMRILLWIVMLSFSAFLAAMSVFVTALAWRALGIQVDRKKVIEAIEEKERQQKAERERQKVGRII